MNTRHTPKADVFPKRQALTAHAARTVASMSGKPKELALKGLFVVILALALGVSGPYGTYDTVPLTARLGFWVVVLLVPWALWETLTSVAHRLLPKSLGARTLMALLMPAFAVIGSVFATSLNAIVFGLGDVSFLQAWATSLISWLLFSFCMVLPLALIADALSRQEQRKGGENLLGFFATKIPEKLRESELVALQSEGHYLRVFTQSGNDLITLSMDEALSALSAYPGLQTHRSWWIATDQIDPGFNVEGLTTFISMTTGLQVPVSRRRKTQVRDKLARLRNDTAAESPAER